MSEFEEFEKTGVFKRGVTVGQLIEVLKDYKELCELEGKTPDPMVYFTLEDDSEEPFVQFDYYKDVLRIGVYEEDPK